LSWGVLPIEWRGLSCNTTKSLCVSIYTYIHFELFVSCNVFMLNFYLHFIYNMPMYMPGLSAQVLYSTLCLIFIYYLRIQQLRHLNSRMPDRRQLYTVYIFGVERLRTFTFSWFCVTFAYCLRKFCSVIDTNIKQFHLLVNMSILH